MRVNIRFLQGWNGYNAGEVAAFDPVLAGQIVDSDVAEPVLLEEIEQSKKEEKQAGKDRLNAARAERIRESNRYYSQMVAALDPEVNKAWIDKAEAESKKMATLISEQKADAIYTRDQR